MTPLLEITARIVSREDHEKGTSTTRPAESRATATNKSVPAESIATPVGLIVMDATARSGATGCS
jgi:hypothetical protein